MSDLDVLTSVLNLEELAKLREQIGAVWEALPDTVTGDYDEPHQAVAAVIEAANTRTAHLEQRCSSQDQQLAAKIRENTALLARTREGDDLIDAAWETLGVDPAEHDSLPDAIETVVARMEARIGDLTLQLGKARTHADDLNKAMGPLQDQVLSRTEEIEELKRQSFRNGRRHALGLMRSALDGQDQPFAQGALAAIENDPLWRGK